MYRKLGLLVIAAVLLQGCATYVEHRLSSRVEPMGMPANMPEIITDTGGQFREFCLPHLGGCTKYIYAPSTTERQEQSFKFTAVFEDATKEYVLDLNRQQIPEVRRGTMIMLHGYGGNKETMYFLAEYYRFIGFHVIIPDLKGHGESSHEQPGLAVNDVEMIHNLINSLPGRERPHPLFITGYSMGAVAAVHVARQRNDISGLVLLAPMRQFEDAVYEVTKMTNKTAVKIISEDSIREGARNTLLKNDIEAEALDLHQILPPLKVPTLVLASERDSVAPFSYFQPLASRYVEVKEIPDRHHFLMAIMDPKMHEYLYPWLQRRR